MALERQESEAMDGPYLAKTCSVQGFEAHGGENAKTAQAGRLPQKVRCTGPDLLQ